MSEIRGKWLFEPFFKQEQPSGTVNSSNTVFTLAFPVVATDAVCVYLDGLLQVEGIDYNLSGATSQTITFTTAPATGQEVYATYITS